MSEKSELKSVLRKALSNQGAIVETQAMARFYEENTMGLDEEIEKLTGLSLWGAVPGPPAFVWIQRGNRVSISYSSRSEAYRALLEDKVEWQV